MRFFFVGFPNKLRLGIKNRGGYCGTEQSSKAGTHRRCAFRGFVEDVFVFFSTFIFLKWVLRCRIHYLRFNFVDSALWMG